MRGNDSSLGQQGTGWAARLGESLNQQQSQIQDGGTLLRPRPVLVQKGTGTRGSKGLIRSPQEHALKQGCRAMAGPWDPTGGPPERILTPIPPPCPAPQHKAIRLKQAS